METTCPLVKTISWPSARNRWCSEIKSVLLQSNYCIYTTHLKYNFAFSRTETIVEMPEMVNWALSFFPPPFPPIPSIAADAQALQSTDFVDLWQNASNNELIFRLISRNQEDFLVFYLFAKILPNSLGALLSIRSNVYAAGTRFRNFISCWEGKLAYQYDCSWSF